MAWEDDVYISRPLAWENTEFCTIPPCDYMRPNHYDLFKRSEQYPTPKYSTLRKREQVREEVWENLNQHISYRQVHKQTHKQTDRQTGKQTELLQYWTTGGKDSQVYAV